MSTDINDMAYETIAVESGRVTTITLDRPESANTLTPALCEEVIDALGALEDGTRVVVVEGSGGWFSAGGDIDDMEAQNDDPTPADRYDYIDGYGHELVRQLRALDQPVVASVSGHAVGAGCNLALACDLIVADETAKFSQVFTNVGLHPDCGGTHFLPRQVGTKKACELVFTGRMVDAEEAAEMGLVNEVVAEGSLETATAELAAEIADGPPIAIRLAKESIYRNADASLEEALDREALAQLFCTATDDFEEGVAAFQNGEKPVFEGK